MPSASPRFDDDAGRDWPRRRAVANPLNEMRHRWQHDVHGAETVADDASRRAEHGEVTSDLAAAAAGQHQQQRRVRCAAHRFRWTGPQRRQLLGRSRRVCPTKTLA
jgi:hypothetical protein